MCVSKASDDILYKKPSIFSRVLSSSETCTSSTTSSSQCESTKSVAKTDLLNRKDSEIRCKYLQKLGIFPDRSQISARGEQQKLVSSQISHSNADLRGLIPSQRMMKDNTTTFSPDILMSPIYTKRPRQRVTFHKMVEVHLIPHKNMFSNQVRRNLWNDPEDICRNALRNSVEFAAENFDWRQAVEDENFLLSPSTGKRIHPAHLHWLDYISNRRRQQRNHQVQF